MTISPSDLLYDIRLFEHQALIVTKRLIVKIFNMQFAKFVKSAFYFALFGGLMH